MFLICLFLEQSNWDHVVETFDGMNLRESLLRGIYAYGFEKPSAIQQRAIIPCCEGKCMIHNFASKPLVVDQAEYLKSIEESHSFTHRYAKNNPSSPPL